MSCGTGQANGGRSRSRLDLAALPDCTSGARPMALRRRWAPHGKQRERSRAPSERPTDEDAPERMFSYVVAFGLALVQPLGRVDVSHRIARLRDKPPGHNRVSSSAVEDGAVSAEATPPLQELRRQNRDHVAQRRGGAGDDGQDDRGPERTPARAGHRQ